MRLDGGSFGRTYRLEGRLAGLPQTLAVEAGDAVVGAGVDARGIAAASRSPATPPPTSFGGDLTLRLDRCPRAHGGAIAEVATVAAPAGHLVASKGQGGLLVIAIDGGGAALLDADGDALVGAPLERRG